MPGLGVNPAEKVHDRNYLYDPDVSCEKKSPKYLFPKTERGPFPDSGKPSSALVLPGNAESCRQDFPLLDTALVESDESFL